MKACVFTLGCKMNEVESASLMRGLEERGYEVTSQLGYADLYLINTCAVTAEAERKSRQAVARMRRYNPSAPVVVCGCASELSGADFLRKEGVTLVLGAQNKGKVLHILEQKGLFRERDAAFCELPIPKQTKTRAFLRIQDGCNRFCSYCIIPYLRGRTRSRSMESIRREAEACGAKEIVLTGIDISSYRDGERGLGELLIALKDLPARIRLGSLEEGVVSEKFLVQMQEAGNVVPHFHLSMQSGSTAVLRAMNRRYTREEFLACCQKIYATFPDAAITTDIIVGFPDEREEDFLQSLSMIGEAGFARAHCFPFSARPGTVAATKKDLPAQVKRERMEVIQRAAREAEIKYVTHFLGTERTVLFEDDGGYSENYIRVYADGGKEGMLARVKLTALTPDGAKGEIVRIL